MSKSYELDAFLEDSGDVKPFNLRISEPSQTAGEEDYFCRVHAPQLFEVDKDIYGIDSAQAYELAIQFVKSMLAGRRLIDKDGRVIELGSG